MKYIFVNLAELNGEREYNHRSVHEVADECDPTEFADGWARRFYPLCPEAEAAYGGYYFSGGEVHVSVVDAFEIDEHDYTILKHYLSIL